MADRALLESVIAMVRRLSAALLDTMYGSTPVLMLISELAIRIVAEETGELTS